MFRASARRLGGRVGKSGGSLLRRRNHASGAADGALAALSAASPTAGALSAAPLLPHNASLRTVLPRVDCGPLKALVAAASMRNLSPTDVPDVAHVLRLDYTEPVAQGGKHAAHLDHPLADIVLVNRLHAVVADYARLHADQEEGDGGAESSKRGKGSTSLSSSAPPLLVLVETSLAPEEAEVQQFVLRSALSLHPLPEKVEMRDEKGETPRWVPTPPLTVMILSAEMTARVRASSAISSATSPSAAGPTEAAATAVAHSAKRGKQRTPSPASSAPESLLDAALKPQVQVAKKVQQHKPEQALAMTAKASKKAGVVGANTKLETSTTKGASLRSKKADRGRAGRARQGSGRRHSRPAPSSSSSSSPAMPAHLAPRLLTTDDATERVLWASAPGHPLPVHLLAPLVRPAVLAKLCDAAAAAVGRGAATATQAGADGAAGGTEVARLHTVVYRAGAQSSAETIWSGALHASATLAASVSGGRSALAVHLESGAAAPKKKEKTQQQQPTRNGKAPWVYLLIHTSLSLQDAAVLQQELDFRLGQLRSSPAGAEVAGISVLSAADVSPSQLCYVLQSGVEAGSGRAASAESAMTTTAAAATHQHPHVYAERAAPPASAEAVEMAQTFQEVYRLLLSQYASPQHGLLAAAPDTRSSLPSSSSSAAAAAGAHPDAFVSEAIRVAALTHVLVQRREAQVRHELDVVQQRSAVSTDSEAVARAAQKVEMKTMVTEAVEEVSVRHEQATAHLVKTLSSMAGQWSLEKLSDTLEAIIRDEVKPIMDVLEERLSNAAAVGEGGQAEPERRSADAAGDAEAPVYAASPSSPAVMNASSGEALLEGQRAMQSTLHEVLEELRGLMARATAALSAAPRVESGDGDGDGSTDASPQQQEQQHQQPLDEARIVEALRDSQQQQHEELRHTLQALKDDLQASIAEASPPACSSTASATAGAAAPAGLTQEAAEAVAAQATGRVVEVLRESIRASVSEQLDSYCEMHRSSRSDSSSSSDRVSLPFLPVTSFELEEMLMRTVNFAVQDSVSVIEEHVRTAMSSALAEHANASSTAAAVGGAGDATTAGSDSEDGRSDSSSSSHTAMKAALEELWAQVKAEAAEEEAVKLSTHNRQLLRLFRRQQHLQRTGGTSVTATAAESAAVGGEGAVTRLAIEEAVRAAMHPYMAQMQATLVAVRAAPKDKKE